MGSANPDEVIAVDQSGCLVWLVDRGHREWLLPAAESYLQISFLIVSYGDMGYRVTGLSQPVTLMAGDTMVITL